MSSFELFFIIIICNLIVTFVPLFLIPLREFRESNPPIEFCFIPVFNLIVFVVFVLIFTFEKNSRKRCFQEDTVYRKFKDYIKDNFEIREV